MIFVPDSITPQQPAFIYAAYPKDITVIADPVNAGYDPASVLIGDEADGYTFGTTGPELGASLSLVFSSPFEADCVAITGKGLKGCTLEVRGSNDLFATQNMPVMDPTVMTSDTAYFRHPQASYSTFMYKLVGVSSKTCVKHIAACMLAPLPFFEDNVCLDPVQAEGEHLISHQGLFLGSVTDKVTKPFSLTFGTVDAPEESLFSAMVSACVVNAQGLFLVPDTGAADVHFGYVDKKYKYEPKMKLGAYTIPAIPFTARQR